MGLKYGKLRVKEILGFVGGTFIFQATKFSGDFFSAGFFGPDLWGEWYFIYTVMTYSVLLTFGINNGSALLIPQYSGEGKEKELNFVTNFSITFSVVLCAILFLLSIPLYFLVENYSYTFLVSSAFLLYTLSNSMIRSFGFFNELSKGLIFLSLMYLLLPFIAYAFDSIKYFAFVFFFIYLIIAIVLLRKVNESNRIILNLNVSSLVNSDQVKQLFNLGFPIMLSGLSFLLYTSVDRLFIVYFLGKTELGYYSIAIMLLAGILMIPKIIGQMIYPRVSNTWGNYKNVKGLKYWIRKNKFYSILSVVPLTIILYFIAPFLINTFLIKYSRSIDLVQILILSAPSNIIMAGYGNTLNVLRLQKSYLVIIIISIIVNVIISIGLYYYYQSITAFAIGTTITYYIYGLTLHFYTQRVLSKINNNES